MPSVINKPDKVLDPLEPSKQIINYVDNKVRNLEKRKVKLDAYRSDSQAGKILNADQKLAVTKYDCVIESLEILKDMQKQFTNILQEHTKISKKLAKKEQIEKQQQDIKRTGEFLSFHKFLSIILTKEVLEHFSEGVNGAIKLSEEQLDLITEFGKLAFPETTILDYEEKENASGEHLYLLTEGKNKEILGSTYKQLKELLLEIKECAYFKPKPVEEVCLGGGDAPAIEEAPLEEPLPTSSPINTEQGLPETGHDHNGEVHPVNQVPLVVPAPAPLLPIPPPSVIPLQPQSLTDVLPVTGNFNFLQESQVERNAHMDPAIVAAHPAVPPNPAILGYPGATQYITPLEVISSKPSSNPQECSPSVTTQIQAKSSTETVVTEYDPARPIPTQTFTNQNFTLHPMIPAPMIGGLMGPLSHVIPVGIMPPHQGPPTTAPIVSVAEAVQPPPVPEQIEDHYTPSNPTKDPPLENQDLKKEDGQQPNPNIRNNFTNGNSRPNGGPRQNGGGSRGGRGTSNGFQKGGRSNRGYYPNNYNGNREGYSAYNNTNNNFRRGNNTSRGSTRGGAVNRNTVRAQPAQQ